MAGAQTTQLSVVIPVFNERDNVAVLAGEIRAAVDPLAIPYEVIFVDDGSTDGSAEALQEIARLDSRVRIVSQARNSGQSAALAAGFRHARGEIIVTLDSDLQNDPADIPLLLERITTADVVSGIRTKRRDTWTRRVASKIANRIRNRLTHETVTDVGCSLRAFRRQYIVGVPVFDGMHRFLPTLLRLAGARVTEMGVRHRPRLHGTAKYTIGNRVFRATADLFGVRWLQLRHIDPDLSREVTPRDSAVSREDETPSPPPKPISPP
jgi:dolichol-phosphate mannosyltransferase